MDPRNARFPYRVHSALSALLGLIVTFAASAATGAPQVTEQDVNPRHMTITRYGYGMARPDQATISLPFVVEGENWAVVEKQRDLLLVSLAEKLAPYNIPANSVYSSNGTSGQIYRDNKTITTYTGTVTVVVRDLSRWEEILTVLGSRSPEPVMLRYEVGNTAAFFKAQEQAQRNAVALTRQAADHLAQLAGTRVIGVLEICEGAVQSEEPDRYRFKLQSRNPIPSEISVVSVGITIRFELAPPAPDKLAMKPKPQKIKKSSH